MTNAVFQHIRWEVQKSNRLYPNTEKLYRTSIRNAKTMLSVDVTTLIAHTKISDKITENTQA